MCLLVVVFSTPIIPVHGAFCIAADFILCVYFFQCLNNSRPFQRVGLHQIKAIPSQHHQKKIQKLNQRQKLVRRQEVLPIHRLVQSPHCSQQSPAWQDDPQCHRNHALPLVLVRSSSGQLLSPALSASGCCLWGLRRRHPWPHPGQKLNGEGQVLQCLDSYPSFPPPFALIRINLLKWFNLSPSIVKCAKQ